MIRCMHVTATAALLVAFAGACSDGESSDSPNGSGGGPAGGGASGSSALAGTAGTGDGGQPIAGASTVAGSGGAAPSTGGQGGTGLSSSGGRAGGSSTAGAGGARGGSDNAGGTSGSNAGSASGGRNPGGAGSTGTAGSAGASSSGCGRAGASTGVENKTINVGDRERTYVLSVPSSYAADVALPLVFAWHGLGGSGTLARQYFRIEQQANSGAIFVYPNGLPTGSQSQSGWDLAASGIDVAFFDALLSDVSSTYCIDSNRVFSTGHSFGAMISNALGCYRGNVLRAIAPVAGMPPSGGGRPGSSANCMGEVAAWIAHGSNDDVVDFMSGLATRDFWLPRNGCSTTESTPTTPSECVAYSGCRDGLPVHWCVHESEHNWPSFAASGIWSFFSALK